MLALTQPFVARARPARRLPSITGRRTKPVVRAGSFDESAAQVRRLVDRDRKELDYDALEDSFKSAGPTEAPAEAAPSSSSSSSSDSSSSGTATRIMANFGADKADKTPVSPFGPSSSAPAASPFGAPGGPGASFARKPFVEPSGLRPDMPPAEIKQEPWWTKITLTQIVIVLSFTTIISLMLATFWVVFNLGAVHFNE